MCVVNKIIVNITDRRDCFSNELLDFFANLYNVISETNTFIVIYKKQLCN